MRDLDKSDIETRIGTKIIAVAPIVFKIKITKLGNSLETIVKSSSKPAVVLAAITPMATKRLVRSRDNKRLIKSLGLLATRLCVNLS